MVRAQEQLEAFLRGELVYSQLSEALQSAIRIHIYFRARAILDLPSSRRKEAAMPLPEDVRNLAREECRRLLNRSQL